MNSTQPQPPLHTHTKNQYNTKDAHYPPVWPITAKKKKKEKRPVLGSTDLIRHHRSVLSISREISAANCLWLLGSGTMTLRSRVKCYTPFYCLKPKQTKARHVLCNPWASARITIPQW